MSAIVSASIVACVNVGVTDGVSREVSGNVIVRVNAHINEPTVPLVA